MIVTNKITGEDITHLVLERMEGKITKKEFEKLADLKPMKKKKEKISSIRPDIGDLELLIDEKPLGLFFMYGLIFFLILGLLLWLLGII